MNKTSLGSLALIAACGLPVLAHAQGALAPAAEPAVTVAQVPFDRPAASNPSPIASGAGVDVYMSLQHLSNGFGDWREIGARGSYESGAHRLQAEAASMQRYGESGNYFGLGDTVTFNEDWFASLSAGAGDGAFYLPRYRVDGFINRKFLPDRNLIGTLGAAYYRSPDGHVDRSASIGATYYFSMPLVLQGEVRFNDSTPGNIRTRQQFVAATLGRDKQTQLIGRVGWGREGYQAIGQNTSLVDFPSNEASLKVRHWLGANWGVQASVERYRNPSYVRNGANLGFFWQLP